MREIQILDLLTAQIFGTRGCNTRSLPASSPEPQCNSNIIISGRTLLESPLEPGYVYICASQLRHVPATKEMA